MPTKMPNTPFSIDPRDPYWQTRLSTPEAGALALEKVAAIQKLLTTDFFEYRYNPGVTPSAGHEFSLPLDGWWRLVGYNGFIDNAGGGTSATPYMEFRDPSKDNSGADTVLYFIGYGVAMGLAAYQQLCPDAVPTSLEYTPGNWYYQHTVPQIIAGPGWIVRSGIIADAAIGVENQRFLFKRECWV